jgi:predicted AlkP superfamily pyrophosphatase or phosphodiesterase
VTPDGVEHAHGPHTPEAYKAVAESDQRLAEIWETLQRPPLAGNSTLIVVSDHGFAPYEKLIRPNVVLKEMGLIATDAKDAVTARQAWCVAQGGSAFVYVLDKDRKAEITTQLSEKLATVEGVAGVVWPDGIDRLGLPTADKNSEAPDLVLLTIPGYSFVEVHSGDAVGPAGGLKGSHGHDPGAPYMHATFVAAGAGIKPGVELELIQNVDVAPTMAKLLGLSMPSVDGRVLEEILAQ